MENKFTRNLFLNYKINSRYFPGKSTIKMNALILSLKPTFEKKQNN